MATSVTPSAAPATPERELTPQERELDWFKNVYQGDSMPQLTVRSVIMGSCLGAVMCLSNLYVGLKTGWGLGVAITACILSYAIWTTLRKVMPGVIKTDMSILENNAMQSTASSAGYSTGSVMVSAISAYLMITKTHMAFWTLMGWTFFLALLGVMLAIPMKRQMINIEQLRFPSGVAAATTLRSLHAKGSEALVQARSLFWAMGVGAVVAWFRDGMDWLSSFAKAPAALKAFADKVKIPDQLPIPGLTIAGEPAMKWTLSLEASFIMVAAGAIMGWKVGWSLLLGAIVNYGIAAPYIWTHFPGAIAKLGYRGIVSWSLWTGVSIMVSSGLLAFAFQWKTVVRALVPPKRAAIDSEHDPLAAIEVPATWFWTGTGIAALGILTIMHFAFHVTPWMSVLAVIMTFFLSLVACRATGETDTTPIGPMGKITQLTYGFLAPGNMIINLMTASVTAGAAASSADLLTDLKSGYLLGANPRKQFLAQFAGIFIGTAVIVPMFYILVPNASVLGSDKFPAPSAQVWAGVALLLSKGIESLHPTARYGLLVGGIIGLVIPLLEMALPKKARPFIPSAMGLGLSMVIPAWNSISMFIGAAIALIWEKVNPKHAATYVIPVSSGIIAGESLMGVVVALLGVLP
jgi:uncharacterized oligopeptide transporter (OPT) family protein